MIISVIILLIFSLLGFFFSKSKIINILLCFVVLSFFFLSEDYYDFWNYKYIYESLKFGNIKNYEIGYTIFSELIYNLGVGYISFRLIIGLVFVSILYIIIKKLTNRPNIVWSAMIMFPTMFDGLLLRNSIAMVICMLGLTSLITSKELKRYLLSIFLFILAALFHSSYWITVLFVPAWIYLNTRKRIKYFLICVGIFFMLCSSFSDILFSLFSKLIIREEAITKYQTGNYSNLVGMAYDLIKYLFVIYPILYYKKWNNNMIPNNTTAIHFSRNIIKLNLIFSMILIPQVIAVNFGRLFRMIIIFNYIYLANQTNLKNQKNSLRVVIFIYALILSFSMLYIESPTTVVDVLLMHLSTNGLFLNS